MAPKTRSVKSKSISGQKKEERNEIDVEEFLQANNVSFELVLLCFNPIPIFFSSSSSVNKICNLFEIQINPLENVRSLAYKLKNIIDEYKEQQKVSEEWRKIFDQNQDQERLVIICFGDISSVWNSDFIRNIILNHFPLKLVMKIETCSDVPTASISKTISIDHFNLTNQADMNSLKTESLTNSVAFIDQNFSINLQDLCEEELDVFNQFICHIILNVLDLQYNYNDYLKNLKEVLIEDVESLPKMSTFKNYISYFEKNPDKNWDTIAVFEQFLDIVCDSFDEEKSGKIGETVYNLEIDKEIFIEQTPSDCWPLMHNCHVSSVISNIVVESKNKDLRGFGNISDLDRFLKSSDYFLKPMTVAALVQELDRLQETHIIEAQEFSEVNKTYLVQAAPFSHSDLEEKINKSILPGKLSFRNYIKTIETGIVDWMQTEYETLVHLINKIQCKSHVSATSLVDTILEKDILLHQPLTKPFNEFEIPENILPKDTLWYDIVEGASFYLEESQVRIRDMVVSTFKKCDKIEEVELKVCVPSQGVFTLKTNLPKKKTINEIIYTSNSNNRIIIKDHTRNQDSEETINIRPGTSKSKMSRRTVSVNLHSSLGSKIGGDNVSVISRKISRRSILKASKLDTLSEEEISIENVFQDLTFEIYLKNGNECFVNKNDFIEQSLLNESEKSKVFYMPKGFVLILQVENAIILTSFGSKFIITKNNEDDEERDEKSEEDESTDEKPDYQKIYFFELLFISKAFEDISILKQEFGITASILFTSSDGKVFTLRNDTLELSDIEFRYWEYNNYLNDELYILRDDGVRFKYTKESMVCLYPEGFLFTTYLDDVLVLDEFEDEIIDEEIDDDDDQESLIKRILDKIIEKASDEQLWYIHKEIKVEKENLCTVLIQEKTNVSGCVTKIHEGNTFIVQLPEKERTQIEMNGNKICRVSLKELQLDIKPEDQELVISFPNYNITIGLNGKKTFVKVFLKDLQLKNLIQLSWDTMAFNVSTEASDKKIRKSSENDKLFFIITNDLAGYKLEPASNMHRYLDWIKRKSLKSEVIPLGDGCGSSIILSNHKKQFLNNIENLQQELKSFIDLSKHCSEHHFTNNVIEKIILQFECFISPKTILKENQQSKFSKTKVRYNLEHPRDVIEKLLNLTLQKRHQISNKENSEMYCNKIRKIKTQNEKLRVYLTMLALNDYKALNYWDFHENGKNSLSNLSIDLLKRTNNV